MTESFILFKKLRQVMRKWCKLMIIKRYKMGSTRRSCPQSEMEQCVFFLLCIVFLPFLLLIACIGMIMGWT